jgi:hypothetical protein
VACQAILAGKLIRSRFLMRRPSQITRKKWLTRKIRYPGVARILRVSRILRVNPPPGRLAVLLVLE